MIYKTLGKTGIKISAIGCGCWQLGGPLNIAGRAFGYGNFDEIKGRQAIRFACERGVTFFDTADFYGLGKSETILGQELGGLRKKVIISSKVGFVADQKQGVVKDASRKHIISSCEDTLKRLKTDYLDVYLLHFIPSDNMLGEALDTLKELKQAGKIRVYGISIANKFDKLPKLVEKVEVIEGYYNMLFRDFEKYESEIVKHSNGFIAAVPLSRGLLTGKDYDKIKFSDSDLRKRWADDPGQHQWYLNQKENLTKYKLLADKLNMPLKNLALAYILENKAVSAVIPGVRSKERLKELLETLKYLPLKGIEDVRAEVKDRNFSR